MPKLIRATRYRTARKLQRKTTLLLLVDCGGPGVDGRYHWSVDRGPWEVITPRG
jgi:hypothetical protein